MRAVRTLAFAAVFCLFAPSPPRAQEPQGFSAPAPSAEAGAYQAALGKSDPGARASALQQFLFNYPNSTYRQPAIAQMMLAKRATQGSNAAPPPTMMNRPMAPQAMAPVAPSLPAAMNPARVPASMPQAPPPPRDSLLQQAPKPAEVTVAPHSLTIKADNSALSQILHDISGSTGMKVDGLSGDERIFGTYGPGESHEVLMSLLQGSGYNVLMVGNANGAPRELSLSQRATTNTSVSPGGARNGPNEEDDDNEQEVQQVSQPPGEIQSIQPVGQPPAGNVPISDPNQTRNPLEVQQELLRLRQQQLLQQQQPQAQPTAPQ